MKIGEHGRRTFVKYDPYEGLKKEKKKKPMKREKEM